MADYFEIESNLHFTAEGHRCKSENYVFRALAACLLAARNTRFHPTLVPTLFMWLKDYNIQLSLTVGAHCPELRPFDTQIRGNVQTVHTPSVVWGVCESGMSVVSSPRVG